MLALRCEIFVQLFAAEIRISIFGMKSAMTSFTKRNAIIGISTISGVLEITVNVMGSQFVALYIATTLACKAVTLKN